MPSKPNKNTKHSIKENEIHWLENDYSMQCFSNLQTVLIIINVCSLLRDLCFIDSILLVVLLDYSKASMKNASRNRN